MPSWGICRRRSLDLVERTEAGETAAEEARTEAIGGSMTTRGDADRGSPPVILWLRRTLRLRDNPALQLALELAGVGRAGGGPAGDGRAGEGRGAGEGAAGGRAGGGGVIPVYVMDEGAGRWAAGAASRAWLLRSLASLDADLRRRDSRLLLRPGPALIQMPALATETGARHVVVDRRREPAWVEADRMLAEVFERAGVQVHEVTTDLLFDPESVLTRDGRPFTTFTPYWRACLRLSEPGAGSDAPDRLPAPSRWPQGLEAPAALPVPEPAASTDAVWAPGETRAALSLAGFLENALADYAAARDRPDLAGTSRLSPHLAFGEISVARVWTEVRAHVAACPGGPTQWGDSTQLVRYARVPTSAGSGRSAQPTPAHAAESAETFLKELGWREFARHLLHHFPHTAEEPLRERFAAFPWEEDPEGLDAWRRGVTGFPIVDAGMRQLAATGWMHNRVRMVAASFLVKDLLVSWQEGADWFWHSLIDADLAANTLGWQWAAGCGADAAPYFRVFNPMLQGERFDPDGAYVRRWVPELAALPARWTHRPWEAPVEVLTGIGVRLGRDYPQPIVDHAAARRAALAAFRSLRT